MWPKILTYVPRGRERKRATEDIKRKARIRKQYRRRRLPYLPAGLGRGCLWVALLLGMALLVAVTNGGA
jgi:hypothetical protein